MIELVVTRIGDMNVRVGLFENDRCAASTYTLATLRDPKCQDEVAAYLVRQVRPQAGPHEAYRIAEMIGRHMEKF